MIMYESFNRLNELNYDVKTCLQTLKYTEKRTSGKLSNQFFFIANFDQLKIFFFEIGPARSILHDCVEKKTSALSFRPGKSTQCSY